MFADLYGEETDRALRSRAEVGKPPEPEAPGVLDGVASAIPSGIGAAGLEVLRAGTSLFGWQVGLQQRMIEAREGKADPLPIDEAMAPTPATQALTRRLKSLEPDPNTTGTAAQIVHGFTKYGGKAVGYALAFGAGGPIMFGIDETINERARLTAEGVDATTASKAAAIHGLASAAGAALPLTGKTVAQTVGLALAGGPVLYSTEIAGIKAILENADYQAQAALMDPFDLVGLAASTAAPLAFGAAGHAMRARSRPPTPKPVEDAARVALAESRDRVLSGAEPTDAKAQAAHQKGVAEAAQRINEPPADPAPIETARIETVEPQTKTDVHQLAEGVISRSQEAANPPKDGFIRLKHAGSDPIEGGFFAAVPRGGVFDGFFALNDEWGNYGTGARYFVDVPANKVLRQRDLDYEIDYDEQVGAVERSAPWFKDLDESDQAVFLEAVLEGKDGDGDVMMRVFNQEDEGSASWEAQRIRGRVADELGYQAVEMDDENGTAYLVVRDTPLVRVLDDQEAKSQTLARQPAQKPQDAPQAPDGQTQGPTPDRAAGAATRSAVAESGGSPADGGAMPAESSPEALVEAARGGDDPAAAGLPDTGGPVEAAVDEVVMTDPDLVVELDDGTTMTAAEALAAADEAVAQAQTESKAFEAAVSCFLRTGG